MLNFLIFLIFFLAYANGQCTPSEDAYLDAYVLDNPVNFTQINCTTNGTITFAQGIANLEYALNSFPPSQASNVFTNLLPGVIFPIVGFANETACTRSFDPITLSPFIPLTGSSFVFPQSCTTNWTLTVSINGPPLDFEYSINNGTTFQISNQFTGNTGVVVIIVVRYASIPGCPFTLENFTIPTLYGCPSQSNCTVGATFIQDPDNQFEYQCLCKPTSNFVNFCAQNCYYNTNFPNLYITIAGQNCDTRYIKLYDGPCCYDCVNCFPPV